MSCYLDCIGKINWVIQLFRENIKLLAYQVLEIQYTITSLNET